jgi:GDP-4-dehydro-6-deoxy-D-mannose reductase
MRALITGASGFAGKHFLRWLANRDYDVFGISRGHRPSIAGAAMFHGDLLDAAFAEECVRLVRPTHVFHLAGSYGANAGFRDLLDVHAAATANVLEGVLKQSPEATVVVVSSSAVYAPSGQPIAEEHAMSPVSLYGVSKVAEEMVAVRYHTAFALRVVRVRPFNLVGPGQPESLMTSEVAAQIARCENGTGSSVIRIGNLQPRRDYVDIRDAVKAYEQLARSGVPGAVYNVCSGDSRSVRECADLLFSLARVELRLEAETGRMRRDDQSVQIGSGERLRKLTGWEPRIPLEQSLADLLNDWRERVRGGTNDRV